MARLVTRFHPQPHPDALPECLPSPFDAQGPHPLARRAAEHLLDELREGRVPTGGEGKMFGVLVVQTEEGTGFLRAFSGMLGGRWEVPGFVPPVFDFPERARVEGPGERRVSALDARCRAFAESAERIAARGRLEALLEAQAQERAALRGEYAANKAARKARRQALTQDAGLTVEARAAAVHGLDQESRGDKAALRKLLARQADARAEVEAEGRRQARRMAALERLRACASRQMMREIHDTYRIVNTRGEVRALRSLFAPREPPSGAADCAGPKLLAAARVHGWRPLAMAELWWGPSPATGARVQGGYYAACQEKCGPLLPFMLEGLAVAPPRRFRPPDLRDTALNVVFEDAWLVVIDKPCGLLSVPGRDRTVTDSVLERLRRRYPAADGPLLVHRLDLDTSGLLVACKDARSHAALQRQFTERTVEKRYVAVLEGTVRGARGTVDLPLRVDLQDRPRQLHDPTHGRRAITDWEVLDRRGGSTRIAFWPRTGRTHQLRVHAAHPLGLGAPIVGDRLYGRDGVRLLLHAAGIAFTHPATGARVSFELPPPF